MKLFRHIWHISSHRMKVSAMEKDKQLSVLADMCDELPVIVSFQRDQQSVTVTIPPPWDAAAEIKALKIQETIKEWSMQYPNVVCYCFDSFSTLLYAL